MKKILANRKRWHGKRERKTIKGIVIHYTGNKGDTAKIIAITSKTHHH